MHRPVPSCAGVAAGIILTSLLGPFGCGATRHRLDTIQPWEWATRAAEHPGTKIPVEVPQSAKPPPPESLPEALNEKVTLRSEAIDIRSLMLGLAKQTGLNITLDPDVAGQVSAYFNDVTVIDALRNIADQLGAEVDVRNNVVAVHRPRNEFRMYRLHYLRNPRVGQMNFGVIDRAQAQLPNVTQVMVTAPALTGKQSPGEISVPALPVGGGSVVQLVSTFGSNFWEDLDSELQSLVFDGVKPEELIVHDNKYAGTSITDQAGRSLVVDSMSGTIMVRARRNVLDAIGSYLDAVNQTVQRQVVIDCQILEVSFSDQTIFGVESSNAPFLPSGVLKSLDGLFNQIGITGTAFNATGQVTGAFTKPGSGTEATITTPLGFPSVDGTLSSTTGTGVTLPLTPTNSVYAIQLFNNGTAVQGNKFPFQLMVQALGQLGDVRYVSAPRLTALHNQKAVLKVVRDRVFYSVTGGAVTPGTATTPAIIASSTITPTIVPEGVMMDVTPLIGDDGSVTMEIHPSFSVIFNEKPQPGGMGGSQPEVERREFDTTVRVEGGQTVVLGGLVAEHSSRVETGLPYLKDIPFLGALFRDTNSVNDKSEIIILLTPHVQDATLVRSEVNEFRALQNEDPLPEPTSSKSK